MRRIMNNQGIVDVDTEGFFSDHGVEFVPCLITDEDAPIHDLPHYTEKIFKEAQTIFGEKEDGLNSVCSDRLNQWDHKKYKEAEKKANKEVTDSHTARWHRALLTAYYGTEILLKHIQAAVNTSNGGSYLVYGFKDKFNIIIDGGDTFEGSMRQFADCFFSSPTIDLIKHWCKTQNMIVEFK